MDAGEADYGAIHFSAVYPVVLTPCGRRGPSAGRWGFVTCLRCLAAGPDDPRIKARLAALMASAPANDVGAAEPAVGLRSAGGLELAAYLRRLDEEREQIGGEIARAMLKRKRR